MNPAGHSSSALRSPALAPSSRTGERLTRAWVTWGAAVTVYFVAVFNRSSLGVAGPDAEHRFGINAAALSTFSVLQMLVYAGMQIPVGVLIDRYGPRRLLIAGMSVMCVAQGCFAAVSSFGPALAARGLLGCGDAMVFISVLRVVAAWFPARRTPLLTQFSSLTGAAGGIASTWPLTWALRTLGWSGTFTAIALICACVLLLPIGIVRDTPTGAPRPRTGSAESTLSDESALSGDTPAEPVRTQMRAAWSRPATRLGLWIHFTTGFPGAVFSLLWGFPFLVQGEGVGSGAASGLLTLLICVNMACCVVFGLVLTRRPDLRVQLALGVIGATALGLTAVLAWPGRAPFWLILLMICAYATNGAGSMIGFDAARSANPPAQLGTASGMVNVGTFIGSAVTLLATGLLVDRTGAEHASSAAAALDGFKVAFCFPYVLLLIGTTQILRLARLTRRTEAAAASIASVDAAVAPSVATASPAVSG